MKKCLVQTIACCVAELSIVRYGNLNSTTQKGTLDYIIWGNLQERVSESTVVRSVAPTSCKNVWLTSGTALIRASLMGTVNEPVMASIAQMYPCKFRTFWASSYLIFCTFQVDISCIACVGNCSLLFKFPHLTTGTVYFYEIAHHCLRQTYLLCT